MTSLAGWRAAGIDAEPLLPALSAYLGHVARHGSYWYLGHHELLGQAARRLEASAEAARS